MKVAHDTAESAVTVPPILCQAASCWSCASMEDGSTAAVSTHANALMHARADGPALCRGRVVVSAPSWTPACPQFARGQDVELFLHPPGRLLEPGMLGGSPFYTCAANTEH